MRASPQNNITTLAIGDFNGQYQRITEDETGSLFFKRFMIGMRNRMGQIHKPNQALSIDLFIELIKRIHSKLDQSIEEEDIHHWSSILTYIVISYVVSLRGPEGFLLDLDGLVEHWNRSEAYVTLALLGRLKGEQHDLQHLIPCANITASRINVRAVIKNHLQIKEHSGFTDGPAISNHRGIILSVKLVDDTVHSLLIDIFHQDSNMFPPLIDSIEKISTSYQCFRTFRRTSATRAAEVGIPTSDVNIVNRWQDEKHPKGKKVAKSMHQHYTQFDLFIKPFLRYTSQM